MPKDIECIRVPELGKRIKREPIFVPENYNGLQEVYQRSLPNCGWVPGMSKLTQYPTLFQSVVPPCQSFTEDQYDGSFRFKLWNFGKWEQIIVDDKIPVENYDEHFGALSSLSGVFWPSLLEKAFYKTLKGYENYVPPNEAMTKLTGGLCEVFLKSCNSLIFTLVDDNSAPGAEDGS